MKRGRILWKILFNNFELLSWAISYDIKANVNGNVKITSSIDHNTLINNIKKENFENKTGGSYDGRETNY